MSGEPDVSPRLESLLTAPSQSQTRWLEHGAPLVLLVVFGVVAGLPGLFVGIGTAVVWYVLGTPYAIAVGHLLFIPLFPSGIDVISVVLVEGGFLTLLVAPTIRTTVPLRVASIAIVTCLWVVGVAWLLLRWHPLWLVATVTVGQLGLACYGLYRYGLVSFGLVDDKTRENPVESNDTHE